MSTKDKETGQETAEAGTSNQDVPIIEEPAASPSTSAKIYPSIPIVEMVDDDDDIAGSKSGDEEWQMIGASGAVAGASGTTSSTPAAAATSEKGAVPKRRTPSPERNDLPPHVAKSLAQMMAMGFSNEGDWLGRLLLAKDGNISMALDSINPSKPPSGHAQH